MTFADFSSAGARSARLVARCCGVRPRRVVIGYAPPGVPCPDPGSVPLCCSVAARGDLRGLCALASPGRHRSRTPVEAGAIPGPMLHPTRRRSALRRLLAPHQRPCLSWRLWTVKEAYLKARGSGLLVATRPGGRVDRGSDRSGRRARAGADTRSSIGHRRADEDSVLAACVGASRPARVRHRAPSARLSSIRSTSMRLHRREPDQVVEAAGEHADVVGAVEHEVARAEEHHGALGTEHGEGRGIDVAQVVEVDAQARVGAAVDARHVQDLLAAVGLRKPSHGPARPPWTARTAGRRRPRRRCRGCT